LPGARERSFEDTGATVSFDFLEGRHTEAIQFGSRAIPEIVAKDIPFKTKFELNMGLYDRSNYCSVGQDPLLRGCYWGCAIGSLRLGTPIVYKRGPKNKV
jgi:hypothetical protein